MLIPEDGCLSSITSPSLAPFNNVMIIKVPEKFQKPGETIYQFATLDHSKKGEKWPADKYLDDAQPEGDYDSSNDEDPLADSTGMPKLNLSKERSQIPSRSNLDLNLSAVAGRINVSEKHNYARLIHNKKKFEGHHNDENPWIPSAVPLTFMADSSNLTTSVDAESFEKHDTERSLLGDYHVWKNSHANDMGNFNPSHYPKNNLNNRRYNANGCIDNRNFVELENQYGTSNMIQKHNYSNLSNGPSQMGQSNGFRNCTVNDNFKIPYPNFTARDTFAGSKNNYQNVRNAALGPSIENYAGPTRENYPGPSRGNYVGTSRENFGAPSRIAFESTYPNSSIQNPRAFSANPQEKSYLGQPARNIHELNETCRPNVDYGYKNMPSEDSTIINNDPELNYNNGFNGKQRDTSPNFRSRPNNFQTSVIETECFNNYNEVNRYHNQFPNSYRNEGNFETGKHPPFMNNNWNGNQQRFKNQFKRRGRGNNFRYQKYPHFRGRGYNRGRGNFHPPNDAT